MIDTTPATSSQFTPIIATPATSKAGRSRGSTTVGTPKNGASGEPRVDGAGGDDAERVLRRVEQRLLQFASG